MSAHVETVDAPSVDFTHLPVRDIPPLRHIYPANGQDVLAIGAIAFCGHKRTRLDPPAEYFRPNTRHCATCRNRDRS